MKLYLKSVLSDLKNNPYIDVFDLVGILRCVRDNKCIGDLSDWIELAKYFLGTSQSFTSIEEVKYALTNLLEKIQKITLTDAEVDDFTK